MRSTAQANRLVAGENKKEVTQWIKGNSHDTLTCVMQKKGYQKNVI